MLEEVELIEIKTLRELRELRGYSQESLASRMGITRLAYMRYEQGLAEPKISNFIAMARELDVSMKTLAKLMGFDVSSVPDDLPDLKPLTPLTSSKS
jgi:transcriptional regulator with XRE-family HTH domain